jgi:hypothetical protein
MYELQVGRNAMEEIDPAQDLCNLPEEEAKALMIEACKYASLKLAQVESEAHFRETIREPS